MVVLLLINYVILHKIASTQTEIESIFIPKTVQETIRYVQTNSACITNSSFSSVTATEVIMKTSLKLNSDLAIFGTANDMEDNQNDG